MAQQQPTFNELLIQEVQNHPELYDQHHRVCTDNGERNLIWEEIAGRIDGTVPGEFAKKRWLQMRDRYRKELKLALRNLVQPKWPYFEKLTWLDPYLKDSKNSTLAPSLLGTPQFENSSANDHSADSSDRSVKEEFPDFPFTNEISTSMLLENIMAASSNVFSNSKSQSSSQCRDQLDSFSPDSAIASTSEDGDAHSSASSSEQPVRSREQEAAEESAKAKSEHSGDGGHSGVHEDGCSANVSVASSESSQVSATEGIAADSHNTGNAEDTAESNIASSSPSPAFDLNLAIARNLTQWSGGRPRFRNPPYLVRRGGGIKVKQPGVGVGGSLSASLKPLAKTLSVGGVPFGGAFHPTSGIASPQPAECRQVSSSSSGNASSPAPQATTSSSIDWLATDAANDEDLLFAHLIVVRLKKFSRKDKRAIRAKISEMIDEREEELERAGASNTL